MSYTYNVKLTEVGNDALVLLSEEGESEQDTLKRLLEKILLLDLEPFLEKKLQDGETLEQTFKRITNQMHGYDLRG